MARLQHVTDRRLGTVYRKLTWIKQEPGQPGNLDPSNISKRLMEKVEEQTLYIFQLQAHIDELKRK